MVFIVMDNKITFFDKLVLYANCLGFLYPIGFSNYFNAYKKIQAFYLSILLFVVLGIFVYKIFQGSVKINFPLIWLFIYSFLLLVITLYKQGQINEGLQKIFVIPATCLFFTIYLQNKSKLVINILSNVMILLFTLNILVFNQWFFPQFFSINNHIMFFGHVQIASEIGLLGIFVGYIGLLGSKKKWKEYLLILLSIVNMLYSQTSASEFAVIGLVLFYLLGKVKTFRAFINKSYYFITILLIVLGFWIITLPINGSNISKLINSLSNGRMWIWQQGMIFVNENPITGFGVQGVLLRPYWVQWSSNTLGFNYAHSTPLQLLLDGGLVLVFVFIAMLFSYLSSLRRIKFNHLKYNAIVLFTLFLSVGIVESLTEYNFFFIYLSFLPYLSEIYLSERGNVYDQLKIYNK